MKAIRKWIRVECIGLLILAVTAIFVVFTVSQIRQDVLGATGNITKRAIDSNVYTYGKQVSQFFLSRINEMDNLAIYVGQCNSKERDKINRLMLGHNDLFNEIAVIDMHGSVLGGTQIEFPEFFISHYFEDLDVGKAIVAPRIYQNEEGDNILYFFAATQQENQEKMILIGTVLTSNLVHNFDAVDFMGDGCLCIIDQSGEYLIGDTVFRDMLAGKESNHLSHIGAAAADQLEASFEKNQKKNLSYEYDGTRYDAYYTPLGVQDWYLAATIPERQDGVGMTVYSSRSVVLFYIAIFLMLVTVICFIRMEMVVRKLRKENDRNVLLQQCDRAVSFELRFNPHVLTFYGDIKSMIGTDPGVLHSEEVYDVYDWIHEDDVSFRGSLHEFFDSDRDTFSTELRIRNIKGTYGWYRIIGILQKDSKNRKNRWFVGKIMNVDEEIKEEKDLMQRAENDLLTGVLNKKTMEKRISLMINKRANRYVIFYMVDLDNFKNVNDTLGHIYGDQAIVETAQALNKVFADQDCIGRLGGDEFAVCVSYQAFDEQNLKDFIIKKAEKICQVNRRTYTDGASEVSISSSVGISYAPDMGDSFEELYTKADSALYYSKEHGKNQYHIYEDTDAHLK